MNGGRKGNYSLTVLMTVHNGSRYLRTGIESILQQTFSDFRFLVVDDGSTDDSREVVRSYKDSRVELLCLDRNVGQTAALNVGVNHALTPWIARMDADDYSAPTRLEEQMKVLEADSSLSCVGTFAWEFRDDPGVIAGILPRPQLDEDIKQALPYTCPIIHGSIVVSRKALLNVGAYDERYRYLADWEMYERFLARYRAANIPKPLLGVRLHSNQNSFTLEAMDELIGIYRRRLSQGALCGKDLFILQADLVQRLIGMGYDYSARGKRLASIGCFAKAARIAPGLLFKKGLRKCIKLAARPFLT